MGAAKKIKKTFLVRAHIADAAFPYVLVISKSWLNYPVLDMAIALAGYSSSIQISLEIGMVGV